MLINPTQEPYQLSETQNQILFKEEIIPDAFDETAPAVAPRAIFLGGQSGSGKSGLSAAMLRTFSMTESAVIVNSDALREYHPDFTRLQTAHPQQASFLVNPDTILWQQKLIAAAVETGRNLILDGTLGGNPAPIQATMQRLREAGYVVQVSVLAVPAWVSRFSIYKRYEDQIALKGSGRWVGMENHDRQYDDIPQTLTLLETTVPPTVDQIQIYVRLTHSSIPAPLYDNQVRDGRWQHPPSAATALATGRNRPWAADEQAAFTLAVETVAERMRQRNVNSEDIAHFYHYVEWPR